MLVEVFRYMEHNQCYCGNGGGTGGANKHSYEYTIQNSDGTTDGTRPLADVASGI